MVFEVEKDGDFSEEKVSGEETETEGWERGSSFSSAGIWRRLMLRVGGALCDGRMRIVDSILPALARGSSRLYHLLKASLAAVLRAV